MENMQLVKYIAEKLNNQFIGEGVSEKELNLDTVKLVESLGGTVYEVGYIKMNGNSMVVNPDDNSFEIYVSAFDGKKRQKFTIAHEIGHYFIHYLRNISKILKLLIGGQVLLLGVIKSMRQMFLPQIC